MDLKQPQFVPDPKRLPSPEAAQPVVIRPGSRLAVVGVFVEIVRRRFATDNTGADSPWRWDPDIKKTALAVESAFNEDKAHRNKRPAVYVDCDEQIFGRTVLGDKAGQNIPSGLTGFWALCTAPILIECIAAKKAESAEIGDLVGWFVHASSDLVQAKFGFHDLTPVTVGRTQPSASDKDQWTTPVTFTVQYPARWTNRPTAALLQELEVAIRASGAASGTEFFERIAAPPP